MARAERLRSVENSSRCSPLDAVRRPRGSGEGPAPRRTAHSRSVVRNSPRYLTSGFWRRREFAWDDLRDNSLPEPFGT